MEPQSGADDAAPSQPPVPLSNDHSPPRRPDRADRAYLADVLRRECLSPLASPGVGDAIIDILFASGALLEDDEGVHFSHLSHVTTTDLPRHVASNLFGEFQAYLDAEKMPWFAARTARLVRPDSITPRHLLGTWKQLDQVSGPNISPIEVARQLLTAARMELEALCWHEQDLVSEFSEPQNGRLFADFFIADARARTNELVHSIAQLEAPEARVPEEMMASPSDSAAASLQPTSSGKEPPPADIKAMYRPVTTSVSTGFADAISPAAQRVREPLADCVPSDDFTTVRWFGTRYEFTRNQAAVVRLLWEQWEKRAGSLSQETIAERVRGDYPDGFRLRDVFRQAKGQHPAWDTMIRKVRNGTFALFPEKPQ